jgi:hypothetical protein
MDPRIVLGLNAVIVAVTEETPRILTVTRPEHPLTHPGQSESLPARGEICDALPFGPFDPDSDRTLELGLRRWIREQTGLGVGYVEQLYTFGNRNRDPHEREGGPRMVSIAYLALVRELTPSGTGDATWRDWYRFFPWEDWRAGRPAVIDEVIAGALRRWTAAAPDKAQRRDRQERSDIAFGFGAPWVPERVLERYELVYQVGLAFEASRDQGLQERSRDSNDPSSVTTVLGKCMALDHRRILASALGRLRGKLKYRPVIFELLPATFTLLHLQRVVEALAGVRLHKQNLRRLVESGGLVEGTGRFDSETGGRPAELFRFRREVLRERPAPGVGLRL